MNIRDRKEKNKNFIQLRNEITECTKSITLPTVYFTCIIRSLHRNLMSLLRPRLDLSFNVMTNELN